MKAKLELTCPQNECHKDLCLDQTLCTNSGKHDHDLDPQNVSNNTARFFYKAVRAKSRPML